MPFDISRADLTSAATAAATSNRIRSDILEVTVAPLARAGALPGWQVGARRTGTRVEYRGPAPWPFPGSANTGALDYFSRATRAAYWGSLRQRLAPGIDALFGLRLEDAGSRSGELALSPRFSVAWSARPSLRVSAAVGRQRQYEQALGTAGFTFGPGLGPGHLWVNAQQAIPALRSDFASVGAELWLPGGWLGTAAAYARVTKGRLAPSPDSGYVRAAPPVEDARLGEGWASGSARALGLDVSARKLAGSWTGWIGYSLSASRLSTSGRTFPVPGVRTHALDAVIARRLSERSSVGAALTAASGAAFTRFYTFDCPEVTWYCPSADDGSLPPTIGFAELAGGGRTAAYVSLDLHAERTGTILGLPFGAYAQLRNALGNRNRAAYNGSILTCDNTLTDCALTDHFDDGMPVFPFVGFWLRL